MTNPIKFSLFLLVAGLATVVSCDKNPILAPIPARPDGPFPGHISRITKDSGTTLWEKVSCRFKNMTKLTAATT